MGRDKKKVEAKPAVTADDKGDKAKGKDTESVCVVEFT